MAGKANKTVRLEPEVREIMSKDVVTVPESESVVSAAKLMSKKDIGCLVVLDGTKPVGMLTERDFLTKVVAEGKDPSGIKVKQAMSTGLRTIPPDMSVFDAGKLMDRKDIRRLPVMDKNRLVGMITSTDMVRAIDALSLVAPKREYGAKATHGRYKLKKGLAYIVEEDRPKLCFEIFADLVLHGRHGLAVVRTHPDKLRDKFRLKKTPMVWLTNTIAERSIYSTDLDQIPLLIGNFAASTQNGVVLLEGIEYLLRNNSFSRVMRMLEFVVDKIAASSSSLIISICPSCMATKELKFLERTADIIEKWQED